MNKNMSFYLIEQVFPSTSCLLNLKKHIIAEMEQKGFLNKIKSGMKIGLVVGSRNITKINEIITILVELIKRQRAKPVVICAMGSHGGGTVEGQLEVLKKLGITSSSVGAPILASLDSHCLGNVQGQPVYVNSLAFECDFLIPINRIKPHTSFKGKVESGLTKMLVVGLGGPNGAEVFHGLRYEQMPQMLIEMGKLIVEKLPILCGIGIVENAYKQIDTLVICSKRDFIKYDMLLLEKARKLYPSLPFEYLDVLVVEQMGKCFSGTGMDTNVIGRYGIRGVKDGKPKIECLVVLDLAEMSAGNANGIGLADITTMKLISKIDYQITLKNVLTTTFLDRIKLPAAFENDLKAIEASLKVVKKPHEQICLAFIKNTQDIYRFFVTAPLVKEILDKKNLKVLDGPFHMVFNEKGDFLNFQKV
ncbi:MAG TPA: DUF2088 domain-containing protein [Peptococcaceae bacterium]|nr:MAG: hypothetical protein XD50_0233 [Clostridia bacterium 41_269]HBT19994.1 DUF2088 domain-containing protein [Peptococcaceae bacterium]